MKNMILVVWFACAFTDVNAQQREGAVIYRLSQDVPNVLTTGSMNGNGNISPRPTQQIHIPDLHFKAAFANNKQTWSLVEDERPQANATGGMTIISSAGEEKSFTDFQTNKRITQRPLGNQLFLIEENVPQIEWAISETTKTILNHVCRKATGKRIEKITHTIMRDGAFEPAEASDTVSYTAWFTTDIPVAAGPEVEGQLPGLILELSVKRNLGLTFTYTAVSISPKVDAAALKPATKGKRVTAEEYGKISQEFIKKMHRRPRQNADALRNY